MDKVEELAKWLDAKYSRHREEEDQDAAAMLRSLRQQLAAAEERHERELHAALDIAEHDANLRREAIAERDRAVKDSERLDWLESHFATGGGMDYAGLDHPDWPDSVEWSDAQDRNFRSLIDAAIAAGGEGEK